MTLTDVDDAEAAVDRFVGDGPAQQQAATEAAVLLTYLDDPAEALAAAQAAGLLTYLGYMSGARYEVEVFGRRLKLAEADVSRFVWRLRVLQQLHTDDPDVELEDIRRDGAYVIALRGREGLVPSAQVLDWCAGYQAAMAGGESPQHVGEDQLGKIEELFEDPSLDDQCRMVILGLMYGRGEELKMTVSDLAPAVGKAVKTVRDALTFGGYWSPKLKDEMIEVLGERWSMSRDDWPEMPALARLKAIVKASQAGWVRYRGNPDPNRARWSKSYLLVIGGIEHEIRAAQLDAWLSGVAAYHRGW